MKSIIKSYSRLAIDAIEYNKEEGFIKGYLTARLGAEWEKLPYEERKEYEEEALMASVKWEKEHEAK